MLPPQRTELAIVAYSLALDVGLAISQGCAVYSLYSIERPDYLQGPWRVDG